MEPPQGRRLKALKPLPPPKLPALWASNRVAPELVSDGGSQDAPSRVPRYSSKALVEGGPGPAAEPVSGATPIGTLPDWSESQAAHRRPALTIEASAPAALHVSFVPPLGTPAAWAESQAAHRPPALNEESAPEASTVGGTSPIGTPQASEDPDDKEYSIRIPLAHAKVNQSRGLTAEWLEGGDDSDKKTPWLSEYRHTQHPTLREMKKKGMTMGPSGTSRLQDACRHIYGEVSGAGPLRGRAPPPPWCVAADTSRCRVAPGR